MGGYGSGRWAWHSKKTAVEECRALDIAGWSELAWGENWHGAVNWYKGERQTASISYEVNTLDRARPWVQLFYTFTRTGAQFDYRVTLQTTRPHYGGWRWWFTCPRCDRRVRKLYLPPGRTHFGCRHCYDLTYRSCQESDKRLSALRRLPPDELRALLRSDDQRAVFMAIKAVLDQVLPRW